MKNAIKQIVQSIKAWDYLEQEHIKDTLNWLDSGAEIYRIKKPDVPEKHLVSYFVVLDDGQKKILLVDHKNAGLWLPTGGHVEVNENPITTVRRECQEELGIKAKFWREEAFFLTSSVTVGKTAGHTDITLWYILKGNTKDAYLFDKNEFNSIKWFDLNSIPYNCTDPNMQRFVEKLNNQLSASQF
jgi:8-oxo-dGTP pyrophosphatase MutT (NUDIX family)